MNEKLEKCPFCGGEVDFWTRTEAEDYQALIIDCKDCPANMEEWVYKYDKNFAENFEKKKVEMFEAWNRRIERIAKIVHKQQTHIVPPKSTTVAYETETNLWDECGNCGAMGMYHGWKYCPKCGAKLEWSE